MCELHCREEAGVLGWGRALWGQPQELTLNPEETMQGVCVCGGGAWEVTE